MIPKSRTETRKAQKSFNELGTLTHNLMRSFRYPTIMEDFCGFWIDTPDGKVWMPGDSRLMEEQLTYSEPDLILMDISDGSWHMAVEVPGQDARAEWLEPVSDEDYGKLR